MGSPTNPSTIKEHLYRSCSQKLLNNVYILPQKPLKIKGSKVLRTNKKCVRHLILRTQTKEMKGQTTNHIHQNNYIITRFLLFVNRKQKILVVFSTRICFSLHKVLAKTNPILHCFYKHCDNDYVCHHHRTKNNQKEEFYQHLQLLLFLLPNEQ